MKQKILILLLTFGSVLAFGQQELIRCGNDVYSEAREAETPGYKAKMDALHHKIVSDIAQGYEKSNGVVYTIPVVFHIVYSQQSQNVSDSQIQSQLNILNEDFRRMNSDVSGVPSAFSNVVADVEIEFCLATVDPNGQATNGITRTPTSVNSFSVTSDNVKSEATGGKSPWDATRYLNIWVCQISSGILGYATPPTTAANRDGVVIGFQYFGDEGTATQPYNGGRTCTHEVGHYLGLRHIWGDGDCSADDGVNDTPLQEGQSGGCPNFGSPNTISCGSQDMFMNYMDYTNDACMFMFTEGQKDLMRFVIDNYRADLLGSAAVACDPSGGPGCVDLADVGALEMGFEADESLAGWTTFDNNNDGVTWTNEFTNEGGDDFGPHTGQRYVVYLWNNDNQTIGGDDYFFSPCFEVRSGGDYTVRFWYATGSDDQANYPEKFELVVSSSPSPTDIFASADFEEVVQPYNPNAPDNGYQLVEIPLPDYGNTDIYIGFHCYSDANQYALLIDDIQILDLSVVSTENAVAETAWKVYPNPVQDVLNIDLNFEENIENLTVNIVDIAGRIVYTNGYKNIASEQMQLDMSAYANGVYFVQLQADNAQFTRKVVVSK